MHRGAYSTSRLAIHGGRPLRSESMPPWPIFDEQQIAAVADVLRSGKVNYWTGPKGREFEEAFALHVWQPEAVAAILAAAGFCDVRFYGSYDLAAFDEWSADLLVLAQIPQSV